MNRLLFAGLAMFSFCSPDLRAAMTRSAQIQAEAKCRAGEALPQQIVLEKLVFDNDQEKSLSSQLVVFGVEQTYAGAASPTLIWQYKTNNTRGSHPATRLAGTLACAEESGRAWVFLVESSGLELWLDAYSVLLSETVTPFAPDPERPSTMVASGSENPRREARLFAQVESCSLDNITASWDQKEIVLSLSRQGQACKAFQLRFDPKTKKFKGVPKDWFRVKEGS
jgi:hypothetical protein